MAQEGLGGLAKKWLKAKSKELTTADRRTRDAAEHEADETARQLKNDSIGEAILTAVPGLRKLRDQQLASAAAAEQRRQQEIDDELASRPVAAVTLSASGALGGSWTGTAPTRVEIVRDDEDDGLDGDDGLDPYGRRPRLTVAVGPITEHAPAPGKPPVTSWWFEIAGYDGPGAYDLASIGMARRDAGAEPEYIEWELMFDDEGEGFYFQPDVGPSSVTVDDSARVLTVRMSLTGAAGALDATARIELPSAIEGS